jgi:hypothetical protein
MLTKFDLEHNFRIFNDEANEYKSYHHYKSNFLFLSMGPLIDELLDLERNISNNRTK